MNDEIVVDEEQQNEETIRTVTEHFQKQLEDEKKKHAEEVVKLEAKLKAEQERHIKDIRDILTAGKISIPQEEHELAEEEQIINRLRAKFNLI